MSKKETRICDYCHVGEKREDQDPCAYLAAYCRLNDVGIEYFCSAEENGIKRCGSNKDGWCPLIGEC